MSACRSEALQFEVDHCGELSIPLEDSKCALVSSSEFFWRKRRWPKRSEGLCSFRSPMSYRSQAIQPSWRTMATSFSIIPMTGTSWPSSLRSTQSSTTSATMMLGRDTAEPPCTPGQPQPLLVCVTTHAETSSLFDTHQEVGPQDMLSWPAKESNTRLHHNAWIALVSQDQCVFCRWPGCLQTRREALSRRCSLVQVVQLP